MNQYGADKMCAVLKVSSSGFYKWLTKKSSLREAKNKKLIQLIQDEFEKSNQIYGSPRIAKKLKEKNHNVSRSYIARIMKRLNISLLRLRDVFDFENNFLKNYRYNYRTQIFYNLEKSGVFTKNNCNLSGQSGTSITYTVPAGRFTSSFSQADADQKALNDLNTNGQTYANSNGSCIIASVPLTIPIQRSTGWDGLISRTTFYQDNNQVAQIFPDNNGYLDTYFQIASGTYSRIRVDIDPTGAPYEGYLNIFSSSGVSCSSIGMSMTELNFYNITFIPNGNNQFLVYEGCL